MKKPYVPQKLPLDNSIDWLALISKMGEANRAVANFNGILNGISNPNLLLSPLTNTEAVLSSKIEGTQVDTLDVLQFEAGVTDVSQKQENDILEVINYRKALNYGTSVLKDRDISLNLIKELHVLLLNNVRGRNKYPGEIRKIQNYIGIVSEGIENARFIPPDPLIVPEYMDNYIEYMRYTDRDILVQIAILHAQFEIIHPFCAGNGRLGRMLIPLILYNKKIISHPSLYISQFLQLNEMAYKDSLREITDGEGWTQWIIFFLNALIWQSNNNYEVANKIINYYERTKEKIVRETSSQHAVPLLDAMIARPVFRQSSLNVISKPSHATMYNLLQKIENCGIISLVRKGSGRISSIYCLKELLDIANGVNI